MNYDRQLTRFACGVVAFIFAMLAIAIGIVWGWPKP